MYMRIIIYINILLRKGYHIFKQFMNRSVERLTFFLAGIEIKFRYITLYGYR